MPFEFDLSVKVTLARKRKGLKTLAASWLLSFIDL